MSFAERLILELPVSLASRGRVMLYRLLGAKIGASNRLEKVRMRHCSRIQIGAKNAFTAGTWLYPYMPEQVEPGIKIRIGDGNFINRDCFLDAGQSITIGNGCALGPYVYITDSDHSFGGGVSPIATPMTSAPVVIGDHCWIGAGAKILKGVELGDHCVVAAGAVVTKSFPPNSLIGGIPARLMRDLSDAPTGSRAKLSKE